MSARGFSGSRRTAFMKCSSFPALTVIATLAVATSASALAYSGEKYESRATVKMAKAAAIALKARPGKITDRELERERGGSGLRYSFDITSHKTKYEVGVDAQTGTVLENAREGAHLD